MWSGLPFRVGSRINLVNCYGKCVVMTHYNGNTGTNVYLRLVSASSITSVVASLSTFYALTDFTMTLHGVHVTSSVAYVCMKLERHLAESATRR